ncbi:unnamed protein product [Rangifer tarandus platyrhynchus]|uniref:Uncharacterized protein n=1 Tax=Rangifer tarandus platyrhynchus TaxID=3082113 RepID=A0ABN8ZS51_RANTA|nr:unnamed protein product [Rangifer tarandus platyrhynchus]
MRVLRSDIQRHPSGEPSLRQAAQHRRLYLRPARMPRGPGVRACVNVSETVVLTQPPPERPSGPGLEPDRRAGTRAGVRPVPQLRRSRRGGSGGKGPDGWAEAAPPQSAELLGAKLWKQKDSDYLSGAGADSSAVRLPGAGRVFSSRKAGGALEPSPPSGGPGASAASVSRLASRELG